MFRRLIAVVALLLLALPMARAVEPPRLLCALCEHFDLVVTYRIGAETPSTKPTSVRAPHDAVFDRHKRLLYVAGEWKAQPCIIPFAISADGAMKRLDDPIPTEQRNPQLMMLPGGRFLYAWNRRRLQVFPIRDSGLPATPTISLNGFDALMLSPAGRLYSLAGQRVRSHTVDPDTGAISTFGPALDAGFGASALALDPLGTQLYVINLEDFDRHLRVFDIGADGTLTLQTARPVTLREAQKKIVVTERNAYVLNTSNTISTYARAEGTLVPLGKPLRAPDGLEDLLALDDVAYVVGASDASIRPYRIRDDGTLRPTKPVPLPARASATRLLLLEF